MYSMGEYILYVWNFSERIVKYYMYLLKFCYFEWGVQSLSIFELENCFEEYGNLLLK